MTTLGKTNVTIDFLVQKLQEDREEKIVLKSSHAKVIGEEGFASAIFKLSFEWEKPCDLPASIVVKIPSPNKLRAANEEIALQGDAEKFFQETFGAETSATFIAHAHNTEVQCYNLLGKDTPILSPKIYLAQECILEKDQEGILMMEDFTDRASYVKLDKNMMTLNQILTVAEQLATLHAFSLKLPKRWDRQFLDLDSKRMKAMEAFMQHMINTALSFKTTHPEKFADLMPKVVPYFTVNEVFKSLVSHKWLGMPPVLVHGDLWACNLLFMKDANGEANEELASIIDWQGCHPGNVGEDFGRLLATSVSPEMRREKLDTILSHYHKTLCDELGYEPYTIQDVHRSYKASLTLANTFMAFGVQMYINRPLVEGEEQQQMGGKENAIESTKASLEDYLESQESFNMSFLESFRFKMIQVIVWFMFKFW